MTLILRKYWWLVVLAIAVFIFKVFPDKLPFLEKIDTRSPAVSSDIPSQPSLPSQQTSNQIPAVVMLKIDNFPQWTAEQLSALKDGVLLTQWEKDHPAEDVISFKVGGNAGVLLNDTWCARTELSVSLPDGKTAMRHAVFYPPVPPATLALPSENEISKDYIENNCTLGIIWIKLLEYDEALGNALALQVRAAIDQRIGKGQADISLKRVDGKHLSTTGRWQIGNAVFISAYNTFPTIATKNVANVTFEKKFFALGFLPNSGFFGDGKRSYGTGYEINRDYNVRRIRQAVETANISQKDGEALLSCFQPTGGVPKLQADQVASLVTLLKRWLSESDKLNGSRKAAALLVADQVLDQMQYQIGTSSLENGGPLRQPLEKHGAIFFKSELERSYIYAHSWLELARTIDTDGPMGDLAFRIMMDMGCSKYGKLGYEDVIKQGEEYLGNKHDAKSRAEVELMVADAYRDIVALASGAGAYNENPAVYKEEAIGARQKAIMHYRNALPLLQSSNQTNEAWHEAWRLIVGLPPTNLRYQCVYD